jgi:hypothetical protein
MRGYMALQSKFKLSILLKIISILGHTIYKMPPLLNTYDSSGPSWLCIPTLGMRHHDLDSMTTTIDNHTTSVELYIFISYIA